MKQFRPKFHCGDASLSEETKHSFPQEAVKNYKTNKVCVIRVHERYQRYYFTYKYFRTFRRKFCLFINVLFMQYMSVPEGDASLFLRHRAITPG